MEHGDVHARPRIEADAAAFLDHARVSVLVDEGIGLIDGDLDLRLEPFDGRRVGAKTFVAFGFQLVVEGFHFGQRRALGRVVLAAYVGRSLADHVFEHVRDAGASLGIVHRARVHVQMERSDRSRVALENDEVHAIGERELGDPLFELRKALRRQNGWHQQQREPQALYCHEISSLSVGLDVQLPF